MPERCHAPKVLSAAPCRHPVAAPGVGVCVRHLDTDPGRHCQGEARAPSGEGVPCYAWPLVGGPCCVAHDPQELKRRRQTRAAPRTAMARGRELLTHTPHEILRGALEILLLSGRVSVVDVETAVWRSRGSRTARPVSAGRSGGAGP